MTTFRKTPHQFPRERVDMPASESQPCSFQDPDASGRPGRGPQGVFGKGFTLGEERLDEGSCYLDKACRPVRDRRDLFIFWDCYNKGPQTEWYKSNRNCFSHCSGGQRSKIKKLAGPNPRGEGPSLPLLAALASPGLCHMASHCHLPSASSHEVLSHIRMPHKQIKGPL